MRCRLIIECTLLVAGCIASLSVISVSAQEYSLRDIAGATRCVECCYRDVIVRNAGVSWANQTYSFYGQQSDGRPCFSFYRNIGPHGLYAGLISYQEGWIMRAETTWWADPDSGPIPTDTCYVEYWNPSTALTPPARGWTLQSAGCENSSLGLSGSAFPTLSGGETCSRTSARMVAVSFAIQDQNVTLVYENRGDGPATIGQLLVGPGLCARQGEDGPRFWIPDSDLWQVVPLEHEYIVEPGDGFALTLPIPELAADLLEEAAARGALYTDFDFAAPHAAVGLDASPISWVHLTPRWLEMMEE